MPMITSCNVEMTALITSFFARFCYESVLVKSNQIELNNQRKGNTDKCRLLWSKNYEIQVEVVDPSSKIATLKNLGVIIYQNLSFDEHVKTVA